MAILLPVLPLAALLIRLESRGPVFRKELLVGLDRRRAGSDQHGSRRIHDVRGRLFRMRSFRVTRVGEDEPTRVGAVLAWTGLSRLPRLLCVLGGSMSLVGPRAFSPDFLDEVHRRWPAAGRRIGEVKPGLFGYASRAPDRDPRGRGAFFSRLADRLYLDRVYCDRLHGCTGCWDVLLLDLSVMARSLLPVSVRRDPRRVRVDYPARFSAVALQPDELEEGLFAMRDARSEHAEHGRTVSWLGGTRPPVGWPELDESTLEESCDDVQVVDGRLRVVFRLEAAGATGTDQIRIDLPAPPGDLGEACAHLAPVWDALAARSMDPSFTDRVPAALVEGLSLAASRAEGELDRLVVQADVEPGQLSLSFEAVLAASPQRTTRRWRTAASAG